MIETLEDETIALVKSELKACLRDEATTTVLLSGEWGVGKTTLIKDFMKEQPDWLYVSAFGAASVSDLQSRISIAWIEKIGARVDVYSYQKQTGLLQQSVRWILRKVGELTNAAWAKVNIPKLVRLVNGVERSAFVSDFLVHDSTISVVVIDDIERVSPSLKSNKDELLGFIDGFRTRSGKRLMLVGNRSVLFGAQSPNDAGEEKVIDREISIRSSSERIVRLALANVRLPTDIQSSVAEFVDVAELKNIRLLKRFIAHFIRFKVAVEGGALLDEAEMRECALMYAALVFSRLDISFPLSLDELKTIANREALFSSLATDSENSNRVLRMASKLKIPELEYADLLFDHVETGVLDETALRARLKERNEKSQREKHISKTAEWQSLWSAYSQSMSDNSDEVRSSLESLVEAQRDLLDAEAWNKLSSLADAVDFDIKDFRVPAIARTIRRTADESLPSLRHSFKDDPDILQIVEHAIAERLGATDLESILRRTISRAGWSQFDSLRISEMDEKSLIEWLRQDSEEKVDLVRQAIKIDNSGKVEAALKTLAAQSDLNAMRVSQLYRISLN